MRRIQRLARLVERQLFRTNGTLSYSRTLEAIAKLAIEIEYFEGDINWDYGIDYSLDSLIVGAYWYCTDYHAGMGSDEYALLCQLGGIFTPNYSTLERDSSEFDVYVGLAVKAGCGTWEEIEEEYDKDHCDD